MTLISTSTSRRAALAALAALVPLSACSSGGGGGTSDTSAPSVTSSSSSQVFTSSTFSVSLSATDNEDPSPTIYYTTDATIPNTTSARYSGPFTITDTTVVRYFAVDAAGNRSDPGLLGFTQATNPWALAWANSGHGDVLAEAFRHWDEDGDVSSSCAKCHTPTGFVDYIEDGVVDVDAPLPLGHSCDACHTTPPFTRFDDLTSHPELEHVLFPSDEEASTFGNSNICITCHQGRNSTAQVNAAIANNPGGTFSFINIHYYAAGATYFGTETKGGYEYDGLEYVGRNAFSAHGAEQASCVGCHMRGDQDHSFLPQVADCNTCHTGSTFETLSGSPAANHAAISTLEGELYLELEAYSRSTVGVPIVYSSSSYPYWFIDTDGDGIADPEEVNFGNRYVDFDERMLKATYNYQTVLKDPAGYIHNGSYLHQLLHDSIADLGATPSVPAPGRAGWDREAASKSEQWRVSGHAASAGEPFRHWDEDGEVPTSCARCHTQAGFVDFAAEGVVDDPHAPVGAVGCATCHGAENLFTDSSTRHDDLLTNMALEPVTFPSGASASLMDSSNICMSCHQGRESGVSVATNSPNTVTQSPVEYDSFDFVNRHYFAAAALYFGSEVTAAYEYPVMPPKVYKGKNDYAMAHNGPGKTTCVGCHMRGTQDHVFTPQPEDCSTCHVGVTDFEELGEPFGGANFDWDGDLVGESFQREIDGQKDNLYAEIQEYARTGLPQPSPVVYAPTSYPYWFKDSNGDGLLTPGEAVFSNRYRDFDRRLLFAAFNFHAAQDPCGDMHNYQYVLQTLFDAMDDLDDGVLNSSAPGTRP